VCEPSALRCGRGSAVWAAADGRAAAPGWRHEQQETRCVSQSPSGVCAGGRAAQGKCHAPAGCHCMHATDLHPYQTCAANKPARQPSPWPGRDLTLRRATAAVWRPRRSGRAVVLNASHIPLVEPSLACCDVLAHALMCAVVPHGRHAVCKSVIVNDQAQVSCDLLLWPGTRRTWASLPPAARLRM